MERKVCSDKIPMNQRASAETCFKRGRRVGFKGGIKKATQEILTAGFARVQVQRQLQARREPIQPVMMAADRPKIGALTLRQLGQLGAQNRVPRYSQMRKEDLIQALVNTGKYLR